MPWSSHNVKLALQSKTSLGLAVNSPTNFVSSSGGRRCSKEHLEQEGTALGVLATADFSGMPSAVANHFHRGTSSGVDYGLSASSNFILLPIEFRPP